MSEKDWHDNQPGTVFVSFDLNKREVYTTHKVGGRTVFRVTYQKNELDAFIAHLMKAKHSLDVTE